MLCSSCSVPEKLFEIAVMFHGYVVAFLILGLKAGLFIYETLGKGYFWRITNEQLSLNRNTTGCKLIN
jgi:formylmethanofuran dehydrogenase subunit E